MRLKNLPQRESHFFHRSHGRILLADLSLPFILRPRTTPSSNANAQSREGLVQSQDLAKATSERNPPSHRYLVTDANWHREYIETIFGRTISNFQKSAAIGFVYRV